MYFVNRLFDAFKYYYVFRIYILNQKYTEIMIKAYLSLCYLLKKEKNMLKNLKPLQQYF